MQKRVKLKYIKLKVNIFIKYYLKQNFKTQAIKKIVAKHY